MHPLASGLASTRPTSPTAPAALHSAIAQLGERLSSATLLHRTTAELAFLRSLDLRCRLEQFVVMPALRETGSVSDAILRSCEQELTRLGARIESARRAAVDPDNASASVVTVTSAAMTHFDRMDRLLSDPTCAAALDVRALAPEVEAWTQRWMAEITTTGDIEDEEQDPVGLPPR